MHYIFALVIMLAICFSLIPILKRIANAKIGNILFGFFVFVPYMIRIVLIGLNDGVTDWNFLNTMPTANVSPFLFFLVPFLFLMPKKIRKHVHLMVALTCVGMFVAGTFDCIRLTLAHYRWNWLFVFDQFCHIALAAWGVYLVKSNQVDLDFRSCLKSGSILVGVALLMMVLNILFDTCFFGLSLNGKHNIYMMVLVEHSYLSALIYFAGLIAVLAAGYGALWVLQRTERPKHMAIS